MTGGGATTSERQLCTATNTTPEQDSRSQEAGVHSDREASNKPMEYTSSGVISSTCATANAIPEQASSGRHTGVCTSISIQNSGRESSNKPNKLHAFPPSTESTSTSIDGGGEDEWLLRPESESFPLLSSRKEGKRELKGQGQL